MTKGVNGHFEKDYGYIKPTNDEGRIEGFGGITIDGWRD